MKFKSVYSITFDMWFKVLKEIKINDNLTFLIATNKNKTTTLRLNETI
jgi:hypothetical protein